MLFELIDSLKAREIEDGSAPADAAAFTLGYIGSALGGFIDNLTPKARARVIADMQYRLDTVNRIRAERARLYANVKETK